MKANKNDKLKEFYLLTFNEDWADEHDVPALACMDQEEYDKWLKKRLSICAHLGNNGDNFMEEEQGLTGEALIKTGTVCMHVVDESFKKIFDKACLASLSLSNIFNEDNEYYEADKDQDMDDEEYYEPMDDDDEEDEDKD
jgi:hypothetical protein